jgi:ATP-binding cassette subfamily B protein
MAIKTSEAEPKLSLWRVFKETSVLSWNVDKKLFLFSIFLTIFGGILPIVYSYTYKVFIDGLIKGIGVAAVVPAVVVSYLLFRYSIDVLLDIQNILINQYVQRLVRFRMDDYLNLTISKKISSLDDQHFEDSDTQNLLRKVKQGSIGRIGAYAYAWFDALGQVVTVIGSFVVLLPFGWLIATGAMIVSMPRLWAVRKRMGVEWSIFNRTSLESRKVVYWSGITQNQNAVLELRIFGARDSFLKQLGTLQEILLKKVISPLDDYVRFSIGPIILEAIFLFIMIYIKLPAVITGALSIGTLTFFLQNLERLMNYTRALGNGIISLSTDSKYIENYFRLMELPALVKEAVPGHVFEEIAPPEIRFQNLSFGYPGKPAVLKKISFTIKPGEHLAIVGPNGAGKTTLIKLLMRFYDPRSGAILINDFNLKDLKRDNWYQFVSTLFQSFQKYSLTIRENITMSGRGLDDTGKMIKAAQMAGADEFIEKFPQKYDQQLGREFDGEELSIGQWQKLALARAFYEEAPVLILDEPTSAIDAEAEAEIFDNLNNVYKDKTVIFISHRFSTVRNADKIIVLKDGSINEEGTHESLMKKDGIYARMFNKQAKGYID